MCVCERPGMCACAGLHLTKVPCKMDGEGRVARRTGANLGTTNSSIAYHRRHSLSDPLPQVTPPNNTDRSALASYSGRSLPHPPPRISTASAPDAGEVRSMLPDAEKRWGLCALREATPRLAGEAGASAGSA